MGLLDNQVSVEIKVKREKVEVEVHINSRAEMNLLVKDLTFLTIMSLL